FKNKPELINQWKRYYDELTLREGFLILNKNKQIEFLDSFGTINNYWFNRFKKQPYLFDKFNTASNQSKLLAKSNPELWIRINRYYSLPNGLGEKLSSSYLKNTYKTEYAERLETIYYNQIILGGEDECLYNETKNYKIKKALRDAGAAND
ncbi:MAG: hypothetical protein RSD85_04675, partial [Erysipelotrichaceae bacterium]